MWARIDIEGVVVELTDVSPEGRFHPSMMWVAAPEGTSVGDGYADGEFSEGDGRQERDEP